MRLTVDHFRKIKHADLSLDRPVTIFQGMNGSGKSSLLGAIQVALTGQHPEWIRRGRGEKITDLKSWGARKGQVAVDFDDGLHVVRTLMSSQKLQVWDMAAEGVAWEGAMTDQQAALLARWDLTSEQLTTLLSARPLLDLPAAAQTDFFASLTGSELSGADLELRIATDHPAAHELFRPTVRFPDLVGIALLDACEEAVREERKDAKVRLAGLQAPSVNVVPMPNDPEPTDADRARRQTLFTEMAEGLRREGQITQADIVMDQAVEKAKAADEALAAVGEPSDEAEQLATLATLTEELELVQGQLEEARQTHTDADTKVVSLEHELEATQDRAKALRDAITDECTKCPHCHQRIDKEMLGGVLDRADAEITRLEAQLATGRQEQANAFTTVTGLTTTAGRTSRMVNDADTAIKEMYAARQDVLTAHERTTSDAAAAIVARNTLPEPCDREALQAEADAIGALVMAWEQHHASLASATVAEDARQEADAVVDDWEWLVEQFGAGEGSYRTELLASGIADLEAAINQAIEPVLHRSVVLPSGDTPLSLLSGDMPVPATPEGMSGSELLRVQVALQYGLARALNFPLVLIDLEAALDYETRAAMLTLCRDLILEWPELRLLMTSVPSQLDWAPVSTGWCATYEVHDATVRLVGDDEE